MTKIPRAGHPAPQYPQSDRLREFQDPVGIWEISDRRREPRAIAGRRATSRPTESNLRRKVIVIER